MSSTISDAGDKLLVTSPDETQLNAAMQKLISRGARSLGLPHQVGSNWATSCTKPADFYTEPVSLALGDHHVPNQSVFEAVILSDTGKQVIISGKAKQAVQLALDELRHLGARNISSIAQVGSNWLATCEDPSGEKEECTVDTFGPHTMVSGPSKAAVESRIIDLTENVGKIVKIEQGLDGRWVAVIDNSGPKTW